MRMTNVEQHELLHEIIHRQTTPSAPSLQGFFTVPHGCRNTFFLQLALDLYNRHRHTSNNTAYNAFVICGVGATTVHAALKLSRKTTGRNKDGGLSASEWNTLRGAFHNVKCLIIDEVSMMSADNLNAVDLSRPHGC
ncbi:hypothetical protein HPB48_022259 [Haemaphysalis longicornis]|uniref:ATP-dependent DNA helicase n=1 Tax=Haemaphysalis longicornis TaxID=44386 RepID=A0A9J6FB38_HAELO|nr:hypothetical protein HPB48_022259 [Haemaphysalis longicornis]